jgi:hypothetical protein
MRRKWDAFVRHPSWKGAGEIAMGDCRPFSRPPKELYVLQFVLRKVIAPYQPEEGKPRTITKLAAKTSPPFIDKISAR